MSEMNSFKSKTKDLLLRPVCLEDASEIFSLVDKSRDSLRQFLPWLDHNKTG